MRIIIESFIVYWATALDLLPILVMLFSRYPRLKHRQIALGQALGSIVLISLSLIFAYVLHFVPDQRLLGLLGLIPLYFGIKVLFFDHDHDDEQAESILAAHSDRQLLWSVALITFASCGADNMGLFIPFFTTLTTLQSIMALTIFGLSIALLVGLSLYLSKVPLLKRFLEKYGEHVSGVIYIGLGILIIYESKTLTLFLN